MRQLLRHPSLILVALIVVTALAYWPGLSGGFLFDDYPNILQEQKVHATELTLDTIRQAATAYGGPLGRPVATVSFAVDHALWGKNPWGYKLSSLVVHLLNAALVFLLVRRLLPLAGSGAIPGIGAAFVVALLWAIHPLQVSTVLYVVQRMETLSLSFVLMALLCYLSGRQRQISGVRAWPWLLACLPLLVLGLLSKESAALLPAFTLSMELTVLGFGAASARVARGWRWLYGAGVLAAVLLFLLVMLPHYSLPEVYAMRDFSLAERLLTQLRVLPMYLAWIIIPQPASYLFYYDSFVFSQGLLQPVTTLLGGLLLVSMSGLAFWLRRSAPLFSLGILWFLASHLITSSVIPLELVFEHRNYFAILGVLLAATDVVRRMPMSDVSYFRPATLAILVAGVMALTLIRSAGWGNPVQLALELAEKNPTSARASTDLGEQYMLRAGGDPASRYYLLAEEEFERGSRIPNSSPMPEQGLIVLAATAGQPAKAEWWDRMVHKLETRAIGPQELSMITAFLRLREEGLALDDVRFADAYLVLANRMDMPPSQYYVFGDHALRYVKDEKLATQLFLRAVDHSHEQPDFVAAMAELLIKAGHRDQARAVAAYAKEIGLVELDLSTIGEPAPAPVGKSPP